MPTTLLARRSPKTVTKSADIIAAIFPSQLGWMAVCWRGESVGRLTFGHSSSAAALAAIRTAEGRESELEVVIVAAKDDPSLTTAQTRLCERLQQYAAGKTADDFADVSLDLAHLAPFSRAVASHCRAVAPGKTLSYQELARKAGSPRAARAVGNVMRANRTPLLVPCHRILAAGGRLGGYSAPQGLAMKKRLLALEQMLSASSRRTG